MLPLPSELRWSVSVTWQQTVSSSRKYATIFLFVFEEIKLEKFINFILFFEAKLDYFVWILYCYFWSQFIVFETAMKKVLWKAKSCKIAPIVVASFCAGVRHKRYSGKRDDCWLKNPVFLLQKKLKSAFWNLQSICYLCTLKIRIEWHYPNKKSFVEKHSQNYAI